jgi:uncharacterized lipoprotein YbaY
MKKSVQFLALLLLVGFLAGCASNCKKCDGTSVASAAVPAGTVVVAAPEPVAPAEEQVPATVRRYIK